MTLYHTLSQKLRNNNIISETNAMYLSASATCLSDAKSPLNKGIFAWQPMNLTSPAVLLLAKSLARESLQKYCTTSGKSQNNPHSPCSVTILQAYFRPGRGVSMQMFKTYSRTRLYILIYCLMQRTIY